MHRKAFTENPLIHGANAWMDIIIIPVYSPYKIVQYRNVKETLQQRRRMEEIDVDRGPQYYMCVCACVRVYVFLSV